jgi:hypothetical protein
MLLAESSTMITAGSGCINKSNDQSDRSGWIKQKVPLRTEDVQMGNSKTERVLGLHAGKGWVSDDFELPLPDEFWSTETSSGTAQ